MTNPTFDPHFTAQSTAWQADDRSLFGAPLVIAHRSMTPGAVPNTVAAMTRAAEAGADLIELDVRLSLDRRPVLVHDAMLRASTTGRGWVRLWPSFGLRRLQLRHDALHSIDRLDDAIRACPPGCQLALHLKDHGALGPVLTRLRRADQAKQTWLWLERPRDVFRATRALPDLRITLLRPQGWHPDRYPHYLAEAQWVGAAAISLPAGVIDGPMVTRAHQHQLRVFTRIDDSQGVPALAMMGVDGFITDDPLGTRQALGWMG